MVPITRTLPNHMSKLVIVVCLLGCVACAYHDLDTPVEQPPVFSCDTISWQKHILPIMTTSCATDGCHDGISRLDWRDYDLVKQYDVVIRQRTADRSMPFDKTLPQHEIDMITCWIDKGSPDN
jgi:hypothetical protein